MERILCSTEMVMLLVLMTLMVTGVRTQALESADDSQKIDYHLTMIKQKVDRIKRSWVDSSRSHVSKRSTKIEADDLMLNSLSSYCTNFLSDDKISKYFETRDDDKRLSAQDITGYSKFKSSGIRHGMEPTVFPTKVLAQRENNRVAIIFRIAHSDPILISRTDPFHFEKFVVKMPDVAACQKIVSKFRVFVDVSKEKCRDHQDYLQDLVATFEMTSTVDKHYTVTAFVSLCKFDVDWNFRYAYSIITYDISLPSFRLKPNPGDTIILAENRTDVMFDIDVAITSIRQFSVRLVLWDWTLKKTLQSSAKVGIHENNRQEIVIEESHDEGEKLFSLEKLDSITASKTTVTLRLVLKMASENRSGKLFFTNSKRYHGSYPYKATIIRNAEIERMIEIKLEDKSQVFPHDLIYIDPQKRFLCDKNGDTQKEQYSSFGKNCTVKCEAIGDDISSLYITKQKQTNIPLRASSNILPHKASVILDVGPSSGDVEGSYQCVAVDSLGKTTKQDLMLYNSLFTEITSFSVYDERQETAHITCTAKGGGSLDIAVIVSENGKDKTRLDTDVRYEKYITHDNHNQTTMNLTVPWDDIKYPKNRLTCSVSGDRGDHSKDINLASYKGNFEGVFPMIKEAYFNVSQGENNKTVSITCVATGTQPIKLSMMFRERWEYNPTVLKSQTDIVNVTTTRDNSVSLMIAIPSHVYMENDFDTGICKAFNKFGSTSDDFPLPEPYELFYNKMNYF